MGRRAETRAVAPPRCKCGKIYSPTKRSAQEKRAFVRRASNEHSSAKYYRCEYAGWHWTSQITKPDYAKEKHMPITAKTAAENSAESSSQMNAYILAKAGRDLEKETLTPAAFMAIAHVLAGAWAERHADTVTMNAGITQAGNWIELEGLNK